MSELPTLELLDIEELDQVHQAVPSWEMSSTQLESGYQESFHHQLIFDDLHIAHFLESRAIAYEYRPPADTTTFFLYTPESPMERWRGIELPHQVALMSPGNRDYLTYYPAGFTAVGMMLRDAVLDELEMLPEKPSRGFDSSRCMIPVDHEGRSFIRWLYRVFESPGDLRLIAHDRVAATLFRERIFEGLAALLRRGTRSGTRPVVTSNFRRYGLTRRALDLIDLRLTERLSTRDIAAELEVSPRVLQLAFRDVLQTSPYDFVLKRKLHAVRHELLDRSAAEINVTDAAVKYGFTELGRFSQRYRRMFGELPSATKNRIRHAVPPEVPPPYLAHWAGQHPTLPP